MQRRNDIAALLASVDKYPVMVTHTLRHTQAMPLQATISALLEAYRKFTSGAPYQRLKTRYGLFGAIKALEITYGQNGWHPHLHVLNLLDVKPDMGKLETDLWKRWQSQVEAQQYEAEKVAFNVREGDKAVSEYIAKYGHMPSDTRWSVENEVSRQPLKKARAGLSPFDMVLALGVDSISFDAKRWLVSLLREYRDAMERKHQLQFSRSITALMKPDSDTEIVQAEGSEYDVIAVLQEQHWLKVLRAGKRGELLRLASKGDSSLIWQFINRLE